MGLLDFCVLLNNYEKNLEQRFPSNFIKTSRFCSVFDNHIAVSLLFASVPNHLCNDEGTICILSFVSTCLSNFAASQMVCSFCYFFYFYVLLLCIYLCLVRVYFVLVTSLSFFPSHTHLF